MPANWNGFEIGVQTYLDSLSARDERQTAALITTQFASAIASAQINTTAATPISFNINLIRNGFEKFFRNTKKSGIQLSNCIQLAQSWATFWNTTRFNPVVPPPGYLTPLTGYSITFPGNVPGTAQMLYMRLNTSKSSREFVKILTDSFRFHTSTITGVYVGTIPGPSGPIPGPPYPWVGIQ